MLATIILSLVLVAFVVIFIKNYAEEYLGSRDPKIMEILWDLRHVHPDIIHTRTVSSRKSYTINKDKIFLCLKDADGNYYPNQMLYYVFLHEFAHKINPTVGHDDSWRIIFDELLARAEALGLYDPTIPPVTPYCQ